MSKFRKVSEVAMAKIAYILLCHRNPDAIIQQAEQLTAAGDYIAIHFDGSAAQEDFARIQAALGENPNVVFARKRIKCGWGEWSLVQATLYAAEAAADAFPRATHFYMVSGDCMPVKSARFIRAFLDARDCDHIESFDFFESKWIKTGFKEERLIYRHFFNERTQSWRFYRSFELQQKLGLKRKVPSDLQIMIGSQWWCLRRTTLELILAFVKERRDVIRFFKTTWIPDETFFQTLVKHLVPLEEIENRPLTFLMFTDYGMPLTFYNDHYDLLVGQDALFARKISAEARDLRERLGTLYGSDQEDFPISGEGRNLFGFLTGRGRVGRRFAPRFWENSATVGRERTLLIIACKKWHVAKRLVAGIKMHTDTPALEYIFNELDSGVPDLGGIETTLAKRGRHRRSLMRMVFDALGRDKVVICLDTAGIELMQDFYADKSTTRLLEIECRLDDEYLIGHARRVGLAGQNAGKDVIGSLLPTIRQDIVFERDRIRDSGFPNVTRIREDASEEQNAAALAAFLDVSDEVALKLAQTPHLFVD